MPSSESPFRSKAAKCHRIRLISVMAVIILVVLYAGAWYLIGEKVQKKVIEAVDEADQKGIAVYCENMRKSGFPLRVGISCGDFSLRDPKDGVAFSSGGLAVEAPIYAPHWLEVQLDSPFTLDLPDFVPLTGRWKSVRLETDIAGSLPNSLDLFVENFLIGAKADSGSMVPLVEGEFFRFDVVGLQKDMHLRSSFDGLKVPVNIEGQQHFLPLIDGNIEMSMDNMGAVLPTKGLSGDDLAWLRGKKGGIDKIRLAFQSGGGINLSGTYSFSYDGYLDAKLELAIEDSSALMRNIQMFFPDQAENIKTYIFALNSMPRNSQGLPVIGLNIVHGEIRFGFIRAGNIPPV